MVEGQTEPVGDVLLHFPHVRAKLGDRLAFLGRGEFGGRAVFVRCADQQHFVALRAHETGVGVRRKLGPDKVPQMFDPVDIRERRSDEDARHDRLRCWIRPAL